MSEVVVTAAVSRTELALTSLDINDGVTYIMGSTFEPGGVTWEREQVSSRFMHGSVTVGRKKQSPNFQLTIDVKADTFAALTAAKTVLADAFEQDQFQLTMTFDGDTYTWGCEAADYAVRWEHVYIHNRRLTMTFSFPREPFPLSGV